MFSICLLYTARQKTAVSSCNGADSNSGGRYQDPFDGVGREDGEDIRLSASVTQELTGENLCASDEVAAGDRFPG